MKSNHPNASSWGVSRFVSVFLLMVSAASRADEVVNAIPSPAEVGRYAVYRAVDFTMRFDSATGATWFLCPNKKNKQGWCKAKEHTALPTGPVGRYRLSEGPPLMLLDSVTGRAWTRCEMPTPEKALAWCAVED